LLRNHQPSIAAQLLQDLVAIFGQFGAVLGTGLLAVEFAHLLRGRECQARVFAIPLFHAGLRNHRRAQCLKAMRVQRADPVRVDGQIAARQFRRGRSGKGRDQDRPRAISIDGVPDFAAPDQVGRTQTLKSIMGPKGAMLVFYRSADW
jgi:hypothetical protein